MFDRKEAIKKVKLCLSRIREIRKLVFEAREDLNRKTYIMDGTPRGNRISNPTAQQALSNLESIPQIILSDGTTIHFPEKWIQVYEEASQFFANTEAGEVIQNRFVERKSVERSLLDIGYLSRKTLFSLQDHVIYFSLGVAEGLGLLEEAWHSRPQAKSA